MRSLALMPCSAIERTLVKERTCREVVGNTMEFNSRVVVVGASAGGVEALMNFVRALPRDLDAAVLVCLHINANSPSALPAILTRLNTLPAAYPMTGQKVQPGRIYIAAPDYHILLPDYPIT